MPSSLCFVFLPQETEAATGASEVTDETSAFEQTAVSQTEATPSSTQEASEADSSEDEEGGVAEVQYWLI